MVVVVVLFYCCIKISLSESATNSNSEKTSLKAQLACRCEVNFHVRGQFSLQLKVKLAENRSNIRNVAATPAAAAAAGATCHTNGICRG